jgi:hypothetical protein
MGRMALIGPCPTIMAVTGVTALTATMDELVRVFVARDTVLTDIMGVIA